MLDWQTVFLILSMIVIVIIVLLAFHRSKNGNTNRETPWLFWMGAFVWADAVILGIFWLMVLLVAIVFLNDWLLIWLIYSVFWMVRAFGEIIYWLNEQFASKHRNPPEKFWIYKIFPNESVWFVIQVYWQCLLVISIVSSVYLFALWLPMLKMVQ